MSRRIYQRHKEDFSRLNNADGNGMSSFKRVSWEAAKDFPSSFKYAAQGLIYAFSSQRNFRIHIFIALLVIITSIWLQLSIFSFVILLLTIAAVLVLELINTAIEAVVDLAIGRRFHPLARIAKDCAAGAVLVASISSIIIASFLLLPALLIRVGI